MIINRFADRMFLEIIPPGRVQVYLQENSFPSPNRFELDNDLGIFTITWVVENEKQYILEWDLSEDTLSVHRGRARYMEVKFWLDELQYHLGNDLCGVTIPPDILMTLYQCVQNQYT